MTGETMPLTVTGFDALFIGDGVGLMSAAAAFTATEPGARVGWLSAGGFDRSGNAVLPRQLAHHGALLMLAGDVIEIAYHEKSFVLDVKAPNPMTLSARTVVLAPPDACQSWEPVLQRMSVSHNALTTSADHCLSSVAIGSSRFDVDFRGETNVDGLFLLSRYGSESEAVAAGLRVGRALPDVGRRKQTSQDRLIYDAMWAGRKRPPDPDVVALLTDTGQCRGHPPVLFDLGCGTGANAIHAAAKGFQVSAVDHSGRAIRELREAARDHGLHIEAVEADFPDWLSRCRRSADVILCLRALHHLSPDVWQISRQLHRLAAATAPEGYLFVSLLTDITYGRFAPPSGRLMISADVGRALLTSELAPLRCVAMSTVGPERQDGVVLFDRENHRFVESFYEATHVKVLLQKSADGAESADT